jgi:HAD superfamily hydrolase (TIGR01509 family)
MSLKVTNSGRRAPDPLAVILDMDGLMLDTEAVTRTAWQTAARECGRSIDDTLYTRLIGLDSLDSHALLSAALGESFPFARFYELAANYFRDFISANGVPLKPGLLKLLDFLDEYDFPRAVATATDFGNAYSLLHLAGLSSRVNAIIGGDQVLRGKPRPDLFLHAAKILKVKPSSCIVIEDSEPGIEAALAAGMRVILVPDLAAPTLVAGGKPVAVLPSLQEVPSYLLKLGLSPMADVTHQPDQPIPSITRNYPFQPI